MVFYVFHPTPSLGYFYLRHWHKLKYIAVIRVKNMLQKREHDGQKKNKIKSRIDYNKN